jgi:phage terminase large subunit-like protein
MGSITLAQLEEMEPRKALAAILQELKRRTSSGNLDGLYPDTGPLSRQNYTKHIAMLAAGKEHNERVCLGGNRTGKTSSIGGYETALHLTGLYPDWWEGWRADKGPILVWAAGTKSQKVRDVNQKFLLGNLVKGAGYTAAAGGYIPGPKIKRITRKSGTADAVDQAFIQHRNGWTNTLTLKSYEEGRQSFEAEAVDFIWLDEEPPKAVYDECLLRLLTTKGRMLSTFTPVEGVTECVLALLEDTDFL